MKMCLCAMKPTPPYSIRKGRIVSSMDLYIIMVYRIVIQFVKK